MINHENPEGTPFQKKEQPDLPFDEQQSVDSESNEEPILKIDLPFGEQLIFDKREPNIFHLFGDARGITAVIHYSPLGEVLDITISGAVGDSASVRHQFRERAESLLLKYPKELGVE